MKDAVELQKLLRSTGLLFCLCGTIMLVECVLDRPCFADDPVVPEEDNEPAVTEPADALPEEAVVPFWRLDRGQTFLTTTNIRRETELQIGDHTSSSDETDRIVLAYGVVMPDRADGFRVRLQVRSMRRDANDGDEGSNQIEVLPKRNRPAMQMAFRVSHGGEQVVAYPGESIFPTQGLASTELLHRLCGPEEVRSWYDLPFRVPVVTNRNQLIPPRIELPPPTSPADDENGLETEEAETRKEPLPGLRVDFEWTRPQHVSLGLLGTLQIDSHYRVESIESDTATIVIEGEASIEPREAPSRSMLAIESIHLSVTEVLGSGAVTMDRLSDIPESMRFSQKISVEGTGVVRSGKQSHDLRVKQLLTQEWIVSEFNDRDEPQGIPMSIPRAR